MPLDPKFKRKLDRAWGPLIGILINAFVVYALIRLVVFDARDTDAEITVTIAEPIETSLDELEQELEMLDDFEPIDTPDIPTDVSVEVEAPPDVDTAPAPSMDTAMDFSSLDIQTASSPLVMRGLYEGRSASGRQAALGQHGGRHGAATEAAVMRALRWLKDQQLNDGSWRERREAMTGLALLAFLAHGETTNSPEFGETVMRAIQFLIRRQREDGLMGTGSESHRVYSHGFATYALAEAYSLTRIPMIREPLERAVDLIIRGQQKDTGHWYYDWKGDRMDTSLTALMVQALKAAQIAGIRRPGMDEAIAKTIEGLKTRVFEPETGGFGYAGPQRNNNNMTGAATLALQLLGEGRSREARAGVAALNRVNCEWANPIRNPLYGWWYITQAKFQAGGTTFSGWNNRFAPQYVRNQHPDGYWDYADPDEYGRGQGPVYSTTLAALTLMVYYRHLPSYQVSTDEPSRPSETQDEVTIRIM